jgi:hypothetical protein
MGEFSDLMRGVKYSDAVHGDAMTHQETKPIYFL